jgi:hypothetical protein
MRDHGNHLLGTRVEVFETGLAASKDGFLGESVGVLREVGRLVWEGGVYDGEVVLGKLFGDLVDGCSSVAWLVCIFLPVCVGND